MNKIKCRTCLNESCKGVQSLTKIFTDESNRQNSFAEMLDAVANINILNDKRSELPQAICGCCARKLKAAHAFVKQAHDVNEKLYSMCLQSDCVDKPLNCLQEVPIDIEFCTDIKMEGNNSYDCVRDFEETGTDFLKKAAKLKQEGPEEDILAATCTKSGNHLDEGKYVADFLGEPDIDGSMLNILQQSSDGSRNNSKSPSESVSDGNEWQNKSNKSKKKLKTFKKLKKSHMDEKNKEKAIDNGNEWLQVICNDCGKIFANSRLLEQHVRLNHVPDELKIQCLHCEAKFRRRHNMYAHMRRIHKTDNLDEFKMQSKQVTVEKKYVCQQCPRSYTNKYKLIAHVNGQHNPDNKNNPPKQRVLLPKKRFLCALCGLKFDSKGNLNIHFRRHTGEKPFKCEFCDRAYPRLYDVTVHRRTHTGEKPYQCTVCLKTFRNSNKLKIHMRTHTNERPYKCTQCEKAFKQSKDLNIHKRTHTGERPYKCGVCHSTFTQSNSLRLHQIKQQHLEKPNVLDSSSEGIKFAKCQRT